MPMAAKSHMPMMVAKLAVLIALDAGSGTEAPTQGSQEAQSDPMKTVWIYINTDASLATLIMFRCSPARRLPIIDGSNENAPEGFALEYPAQE